MCLLDAWYENDYLTEQPRLVWQSYLTVCCYQRDGELTTVALGACADPPVYKGDVNGKAPSELHYESFSQFVLWSVLYKAKAGGEFRKRLHPFR